MREKIKKELLSILDEFYGVDKILVKENDSLSGDLNLTSLDILELLMQLNKNLKTNVPDEESIQCKKVCDVIDLFTSYSI